MDHPHGEDAAKNSEKRRSAPVLPGDVRPGPRQTALAWLLAMPILLAFWLVTRPYDGIVHDARLYTAGALANLEPARFAHDLFFASGSQDTFTVFSTLYAPLVAAAGVRVAHYIGLVVAHTLWLAALAWLMSTMFGRTREAIAATATAILLDPRYALLGIFGYGEHFLTPRPLAEAAVMAALAAAIRQRWIACIALLLAGAALHPIMTLPGLAATGLLAARQHRRIWFFAAAAACMMAGLAYAGVDPFVRIMRVYDPEWLAIARERGAVAFIGSWTWRDWLRAAPAAILAVMALLVAARNERAIPAATLAVAAGGIATSFIGGDLAANVLLVGIQPWRALWLLAVIANAWAAVVVVRLPRDSAARQFLLVGLGIALVERWLGTTPLFAPPTYLIALGALGYETWAGRPLPRTVWWVGAIAATVMVFLLVAGGSAVLTDFRQDQPLAVPAICAFVTILGVSAVVHESRCDWCSGWRIAVVGIGLTGMAATAWDRRSDWAAFESNEDVPADLAAFAADAGSTVYWQHGLPMLWLKLRTSSGWSCTQGAGVIFFRGTALEFARRADALATLNTDGDFDVPGRSDCPVRRFPDESGPRDASAVIEACRAWPELDSIVIVTAFPDLPHVTWQPPTPLVFSDHRGRVARHDAFHLYRCALLR